MATVTTPLFDGVIIGTREATIAQVIVSLDGDEALKVDGTAKRDPQDTDSVEIAELLALGRALELAGRKLLKKANGLIKHQDDIRQYKEIQKAKKNATKKKGTSIPKTLAKASLKR